MKKAIIKFLIPLWILLNSLIPLNSQEKREVELTAQEILARADLVLNYPRGLLKGRLMHILPEGKAYNISIIGYISKNDYLFKFSSRGRGEELKILYNYKGEDVWVYKIHSLKLFHKAGIDKYDPVLSTNFNYLDFSNADLQSNYTASITGDAYIKGYDAYRLTLKPIFKGGNYGLLTLYVRKKNFVPLRVDYHDKDKVIFKTLSIAKTIEKGNRIFPIRYDMLNIRKGTVSILNFNSIDQSISHDKKIFRHDNLGG